MLMSDASFGVNHYESGVQTVGIPNAYLDLCSHLNTPVQEQVSEPNTSYYVILELMLGIQAKDSNSSSADLISDDSSSTTRTSNNNPTVDISQVPPKA